jgi:hypothetical protein
VKNEQAVVSFVCGTSFSDLPPAVVSITKDQLLVPPPSPGQSTPRPMRDPGNLYAGIPPIKGGVEA